MNDKYVLDACALLALLRNEPGENIVSDIINAAGAGRADISIHKNNLFEV